MRNRIYLTVTAVVAAVGGLIVVASYAFNQATANWIIFGLSVTAVAVTVVGLGAVPRRDASRYRALGGLIGLLAAFTIIVSVGVFTGNAQHWLLFGGGVLALVLASLGRETYVASLTEASRVEDRSDAREPLRAAA